MAAEPSRRACAETGRVALYRNFVPRSVPLVFQAIIAAPEVPLSFHHAGRSEQPKRIGKRESRRARSRRPPVHLPRSRAIGSSPCMPATMLSYSPVCARRRSSILEAMSLGVTDRRLMGAARRVVIRKPAASKSRDIPRNRHRGHGRSPPPPLARARKGARTRPAGRARGARKFHWVGEAQGYLEEVYPSDPTEFLTVSPGRKRKGLYFSRGPRARLLGWFR